MTGLTKSESEFSLEELKNRLSSARNALEKASEGQQELVTLYKIAELLASTSDTGQLLANILDLAIDLTKAERGMMIFQDEHSKELAVKVARNIQKEVIQNIAEFSQGIVRKVLESQEAFMAGNAQNDPRLKTNKSISNLKIQSLICVPIVMENRTAGTIYVDSRSFTHVFDQSQKEFLIAVAKLAGVILSRSRMEIKLKADYANASDQVKLLRQEVKGKFFSRNLIGRSAVIHKVFDRIHAVADSNVNVLVMGESGTGKELIARAIHYFSKRADKPFVALNCAALPESLLESELFGHEKGAFTGASNLRKGKFEAAHEGTLFLDEIGDMSTNIQAKVLRALQEREFSRLGGNDVVSVDIRVIAATNRNLEQAIQSKEFREDLYYRLNVVTIAVPPLRERGEDILLLAEHFLDLYSREHNRPMPSLSLEARNVLLAHAWDGNIRELENAMNQCVVLCHKEIIALEDLPEKIRRIHRPSSDFIFNSSMGFQEQRDRYMSGFERDLLHRYLKESHGNVTVASRMAQLSRVHFHRLMTKYDLDPQEFRPNGTNGNSGENGAS